MSVHQACRGYGYPWRSPWMDIEVLVISMDTVDIHLKALLCKYHNQYVECMKINITYNVIFLIVEDIYQLSKHNNMKTYEC